MKIVKKILTAVLCAALATGIAAVFAGCGHAHVWSDEWESDSVGHSHECTECGEVATEEHTYSGGVCVVCGYECEHGEWESDKLNHWQTCAECGEQFSGEHNFVSGECTVCGYECVHEYAAEWSCDTQTHWHECAICASVNGEKAHEYLLGKCTECGYVCVHGGIQWEITELNHYGTCAQCGTTLSGRHEYSDGVCTVCGRAMPKTITINELIKDTEAVDMLMFMSSIYYTAEDSDQVARIIAAFNDVLFVEMNSTDKYFEPLEPSDLIITCDIYFVRYIYSENGDIIGGSYIVSGQIAPNDSAFVIIRENGERHYYYAKPGTIDFYAIMDEYHGIMWPLEINQSGNK